MKRAKLHVGMASVGLLVCVALMGLVGYSIGGDEPDVSDLTRPKEPKDRVYDSRIQMHRMDWTFKGDEVLYRRKTKNQPELPPGARDDPRPVNSELRSESPYVPPTSSVEETIDDTRKNWILPPAPEGTEQTDQPKSAWDTLMLTPAKTPDVTNPYAPAATNKAFMADEKQQNFQEVADHFLMSEEDLAALAEEEVGKKLREDKEFSGYQPAVSQSSFGEDSVVGFGTSLLSREGDEDTEDSGYGYRQSEDDVEDMDSGDAERSLSDRLGLGRSNDGLQLTRRTLGFDVEQPDPDASPDAETRASSTSVGTDSWRGVFKGIDGSLQTQATFDAVEVETSTYLQESLPAGASFLPAGTSDTYRDAFSPAGSLGNTDVEAESTYGSADDRPTSSDPFSFTDPSYEPEGFSFMGDGQQRLKESSEASRIEGTDPFAKFNRGLGDPGSSLSTSPSSGATKDPFRVLMR